jgi:DNA-binding winged helix-turn-helix (wHTH) protein
LSEFPEALRFGKTVVMVQRRELSRAGGRIEIGARAFDLLLLLIQARGAPVGRDAIKATIWSGRIVEENTVESQISALRRALGEDRDAIRTIAGRGYQFVADVTPLEGVKSMTDLSPVSSVTDCVAATQSAATPLIGREQELKDLAEITKTRRLVTLVGTGGVGKTRLAFEVARNLAAHFSDGLLYTELAATSSADYLSSTLAIPLGNSSGEQPQTLD